MSDVHLTCGAAVAAVLEHVEPRDLVVAANGHISRECHARRHRPGNFYMIGSMGLAPSIGLGLSLADLSRWVVVLDGDGNALMGLGGLAMVGGAGPERFLHVLLDNGRYESTGGQPTLSGAVDWCALAVATGYRQAASVGDLGALRDTAARLLSSSGPSLLHVALGKEQAPVPPRVSLSPVEISANLRAALSVGGAAS